MEFCWPNDTDYPVTGLGGDKKKLGLLVMNGYRDIRDVPSSEISGQTQERIHRVTREGLPELLPGAVKGSDPFLCKILTYTFF
jgi:hypothetical protein